MNRFVEEELPGRVVTSRRDPYRFLIELSTEDLSTKATTNVGGDTRGMLGAHSFSL